LFRAYLHSMILQIRFDPLVNSFLKNKYPEGIKYCASDNISLAVFGLLCIPKVGDINVTEDDGIQIFLPDQYRHDNRTFLPHRSRHLINQTVSNQIKQELFKELEIQIQLYRGQRYSGINECIKRYMVRYGLDLHTDFETYKRAFHRHRKRNEYFSGDDVLSRHHTTNVNSHHERHTARSTR
jgi:hypothetical protein